MSMLGGQGTHAPKAQTENRGSSLLGGGGGGRGKWAFCVHTINSGLTSLVSLWSGTRSAPKFLKISFIKKKKHSLQKCYPVIKETLENSELSYSHSTDLGRMKWKLRQPFQITHINYKVV